MEERHTISFGQRLLRERKIHQWTQEQLAERIGVRVLSINRWEHDLTVPRNDSLEELVKVFGRPPERWGSNKWWNVPYLRNLYFTGREQVIERLQEALVSETSKASSKIRVLSGMGGIGKTQIALEFAYRYADTYDAVLWVQAETQATMNTHFAGLAQTLHLPDHEQWNAFEARKAVKEWLQNHNRWLLIFDNADTTSLVFTLLPSRYSGAVLVTTRSQIADPHVRSIEIEKMTQSETITFLVKRTSHAEEDQPGEETLTIAERVAMVKLWETMDGLPLALDQAGAYVKMARCSFQEYMDLYHVHRRALLTERGAHTPEHPDAVATTWNLSFGRIERESPAATELLRFCAFLAPNSIPEELVVWGAEQGTARLQQLAASKKALRDAIKTLSNYSLIQRDPITQTLLIHRLVQVALVDALAVETREEWKQRVLRMLNTAFTEAPFQDWARYGQLLPHIQLYTNEIEQESIAMQVEAAHLFDKAGSYLREQGQYAEAASLLVLALELRRHHLPANDLAIATSLSNLAGLYFYQDHYQQATTLVERALAIRRQQLGTDHLHTTESLKHLALLYLRQELYEQAEPLLLQSLMISERQTGFASPATTNRMNNLALVYLGQKRYDEAESLLRKAYVINKRCLGVEHPETARAAENLAFVYVQQGRYKRAEPLLYKALFTHMQQSGLESPDTAYPLFGLAELWRRQKKYTQSEALHQHVLALRQKHLGNEHLDTAESQQALGDLYREWVRYQDAASYYEQALAIREKMLRGESPSVLESRKAYAETQQLMQSLNR